LIADVIRRGVAVIATPANTPATLAAKAATNTIPIVFGVADDPVRLGLVDSLSRPSGNATGINFLSYEIIAKRLGLMHQLLPKVRRFAVLINPVDAVSAAVTTKSVKEAAGALDLETLFFNASTPTEIDTAFSSFSREQIDASWATASLLAAARKSPR
jgi:putative ABC transport system substrate-binding protein